MAILTILTFPEPVLRERAEPVEVFDAELEKLAHDMLETMYDAPGVGLAANQIGVLKRIAVLDVEYDIEGDEETEVRRYRNKNPIVVVNPEILEKKGAIKFKEGCLSVPGVSEEVDRVEKLKLSYQDLKGQKHVIDAEGLLAIAVQHEIDHLDGKLFIDRLSTVKKEKAKSKLKKDLKRERGARFERSKFHVEL